MLLHPVLHSLLFQQDQLIDCQILRYWDTCLAALKPILPLMEHCFQRTDEGVGELPCGASSAWIEGLGAWFLGVSQTALIQELVRCCLS